MTPTRIRADTITFASSLAGQTITLTSGELDLTDTTGTTTITGLGANQLTISGNNASRVFDISGAIVDISGLTISNGYSVNDSGGGVFNGGTVTISNCTISGNLASANGGGIENVGTATITGSTISGNSGQFGGGLREFDGLVDNYGQHHFRKLGCWRWRRHQQLGDADNY